MPTPRELDRSHCNARVARAFPAPALLVVAILLPCAWAAGPPAHLPGNTGSGTSPNERAFELVARRASATDVVVGSPFGRPISLSSHTEDGVARGEAVAELDLSMPALRAVLEQPQRWCELLLLTPQIGGCATSGDPLDGRLEMQILSRFDQGADNAPRVTFRFSRQESDDQFLALRLDAAHGPWGTMDHRLDVEVAPLDDRRSVLRVGYSYRYGFQAMATLGLYLVTSGRSKHGFSLDPQGRPVRGFRGSVERNVMRYLLAIEAHVTTAARDPEARFQAGLDRWLEGVDRYPPQIAELDRSRYRQIKLRQFGTVH